MDIFINERSFDNKVKSYTVMARMQQFADTVQLLRTICHDAEIVIHSTLSNRVLCDGQTLISWLSYTEDDDHAEEQSDEPPLQALIGVVLAAFSRGPYLEDLLAEHEHRCWLGKEDHHGSAVAAAACLEGVVVSLDDHPAYKDGPLTVRLMRADGNLKLVDVPHFVTVAEARKCRRRYVPNAKHHPDRRNLEGTRMPLDREYDEYTDAQRQSRRAVDCDPFDTCVQWLLDRALPGGRQLYNLLYSNNGRTETFYEFMDDNMNSFHGYPVPVQEVPSEVVRQLRLRPKDSG